MPALAAPVRRVTLMEDRALVTREGAIELEAGSHRLRVEGVSPVVGDRSLLARVSGAAARVDESRVVRRWRLPSEGPRDVKGEASRREEAESGLRAERTRRDLRKRRLVLAEAALGLVSEGIDRELPYAESFQPRWGEDFASFAAAVRAAEAEVGESDQRKVELARERDALTLSGAKASGEPELEVSLELEVTVHEAGRLAISLDYMVPCALWRPVHRATLRGGTTRFECEGAVWQATGEDWSDVELRFSTARPTQRAEPPTLSDDRLRVQKRRDKKVDVSVREEVIATTGEGRADVQSELPGVDDGGETRTLGAPQTVSIASDGRLRRIPIFTSEGPAEIDRICCPEQSPLVHLRSRQVNTSAHPILAGPLELVQESGTVGRGEVPFVGPSERFVLGWGAEDAVRVVREQEEEEKEGFLGRKRVKTRTVTLRISNLEATPIQFKLQERVPVSEVEEVTIAVDSSKTQPPAETDDQGIVTWTLDLRARAQREVKLVYTVTSSSKVRGI